MSVTVFDLEYRTQRVGALRTKLAESGCRITPQRIAILDALVNGASHPTAEEIYGLVLKVSPTTSLATVYKTLDTLKALGEVQELELGSGRNHYDAVDPVAHPHVVCTQCGRIEDVRLENPSNRLEQASKASGYRLVTERLEFFGLCKVCQTD
jgi:Fur family peroxide stress response transcriptional regulator